MQIEFNLTEEDYLSFNLQHVKHSKTATRSLRLQQILVPVIYIFLAYIFSVIVNTPFLFFLIPFLIISMVWIIFYPKFFYSSVMRNVKKMLREGKAGGIIGKYTMTLSDEGIIQTSTTEEKKASWPAILSLQEDEERFYLYNSAMSAYIIPKRALKNSNETREWIQGRLGNR
ncbi:YcxB family protein [Planococcus sp. 1R117A]|uniref:YcxB family protein n=1 Tax=Planococcus sp. 1R117A TaxID=3447020 RepID=UPI003EDB8917